MQFITMAGIFFAVLVTLIILVLVIQNRSKNPKPKKKKKSAKEKKQRNAKIGAFTLVAGTSLADFFLYQKVGIAILIGVSLIVTIIAVAILQTAGGGIKTIFARANKNKPKGPYIDDDGVFHADPDYKFDPSEEPMYNYKVADTYEDDEGNIIDTESGEIISPVTNTDTSYQEDPRRLI